MGKLLITESPISDFRLRTIYRHRRGAESAKKKLYWILYELSKRILGTAIEVLSVKRGATAVFYLLKSQRTLRLCGEKRFFNLGI